MRNKKWMIFGTIGAIGLIVALMVFQPWLLFIDKQVNDQLPTVAANDASVTSPSAPGFPTTQDENQSANTDPSATAVEEELEQDVAREIAVGTFISHEHETSGRASIVRLASGRHQLVFQDLSTTLGPDVRVWLSAGPVVEGNDGWFTAGQHPHLDVGELKGNLGNQVYDLPADFDPAQWPTVDLWCEDFSVSFGAAALQPVA